MRQILDTLRRADPIYLLIDAATLAIMIVAMTGIVILMAGWAS